MKKTNMIIYNKDKEISSIYKNGKVISLIYKGATLLWEAINSCFGKGYWLNIKPWNNKDGWRLN